MPARAIVLLLEGAVLALCVATVGVSLQNRTLRGHRSMLLDEARRLHRGVFVPVFETTAIDGHAVDLGAPPEDRFQGLFFFTTTCPFCEASIPALKATVDSVQQSGPIDFVLLSLDPPDSTALYAAHHGLSSPIVSLRGEPRMWALYRAGLVPLLVVVDTHGRVVYDHVGPIRDLSLVDSIFAAMAQAGGPPEGGALSRR